MMTTAPGDTDLPTAAVHQLRFDSLPYAAECPDRDVVIFDGDCKFCLRSVQSLRRLDLGGTRLAFVSLHDPIVAERFPSLGYDEMMKQMYVVDRSGGFHGGAVALRYLSRRLPILWLAAPFLHIPFSMPLWQTGYRWIANRRYRIAGRNTADACEGSCSLHFKD